jgi:hypothetical protein
VINDIARDCFCFMTGMSRTGMAGLRLLCGEILARFAEWNALG